MENLTERVNEAYLILLLNSNEENVNDMKAVAELISELKEHCL